MRRLSHSQIEIWKGCKRRWYLQYIKKIRISSDMKYANAGSVIHDTIEYHFTKNQTLPKSRQDFDAMWKKYSLELTDLEQKKETYWFMVLKAIDLNINHTEFEEIVNVPGFYARTDATNFKEGILSDWKSSTYGPWNVHEYRDQLRRYCWAIKEGKGILMKEANTYYLKESGSKAKLTYIPTEEDVALAGQEITDVRNEIDTAITTKQFPKCCDDGSKCAKFCPYGEICFGKNKLSFKLIVNRNYIQIVNKLSPKLTAVLKKHFSYMVQGAVFIQQHSSWSGCMELYNERSQTVRIGFRTRLIKLLQAYAKANGKAFDFSIEDKRQFTNQEYDVYPKELPLTLRPYQNDAVMAFMREEVGIINVATGGGKTEISFEIIRQLKRKTLFVVNRKELLQQTKERMEKAFGFEVGIIQGKNQDITRPITVATIQTLTKDLKKYKQLLDKVEFVITDECHLVASKSFRKLYNALPIAQFKLGLSATPKRDDGDDMLIEENTGAVVYKKSAKELQDEGYIMRPTIHFYHSILQDPVYNYHEDYTENIVNNDVRNKLCLDLCEKYEGKKILILCKSVEHGAMISENLEGSFHLHGSVNKKAREEQFGKFKTSGLNVLVSTLSIAQQGLDIKDLDVIINLSANKGDVASIQVIGRVLRMAFGKKEALYIDFIDYGTHTSKHSMARIKTFQNEGYAIEVKQNI